MKTQLTVEVTGTKQANCVVAFAKLCAYHYPDMQAQEFHQIDPLFFGQELPRALCDILLRLEPVLWPHSESRTFENMDEIYGFSSDWEHAIDLMRKMADQLQHGLEDWRRLRDDRSDAEGESVGINANE